jgi:hypothetical protein
MKRLILQIYIQLFVGLCISCKAENQISQQNPNSMSGTKLIIKIGQKAFAATLLDNATVTAFKALLPLTIKMNELNNNEKFADLSKSLPTNASVPSSIQAGDLMMYGSRTLVLFYKGFFTSYSYTKIGKIDDVSGLLAALGSGEITVSYELQ